ncbi:fungal-specific transcription factor domain-containing protein, partial [Leptodontidium sp. 2 PMI_412]
LPSPPAVDELINIFFSEINWLYGIIQPVYFNQAFKKWKEFTTATADPPRIESISSDLRSFPSLLAQLLAISMMYLPPGAKIEGLPAIKYLDLSQRYSEIGVDLVRLLGHQGTTIVTVQHDLMRAAWLKNRGHGAEAWHALSKAIRKAQELGLHRHSRKVHQSTGESFWHDEWKKKLWIVLYVWDSNMSLLLGRPRLINASDCEANLPIDCEFPETSQEMSTPTPRSSGSLNDKVPSSVRLSLFMYNLSHKIHEIRSTGADRPGFQDYAAIQRLHSEILSMLEQLPLTIRWPNPDKSWDLQFSIIPRQREKIHTATYCVLMALHRPHIGRHVESRETVLKAGLAILESQQRFFDSITRVNYAFFGNAFFSIDAVIVLSTTVEIFLWGDVNLLQRLVLATQTALGRLCIIEPQNEMARAAINIVRSCHHTVKEA